MGRIIRIAVGVLVVYAIWQTGSAYWQYLELQNRLDQVVQLGVERSEEQVRATLLDAAAEFGVRLNPEQIVVQSSENSLSVDAAYQRPIQILPGVSFSWTFTLKAHAYLIPSGGVRKSPGGGP